MAVTLELPPALETVAREHAKRDGRPVEEYLVEAIGHHIQEVDSGGLALARFRQEVADSGMTEDQLEELFEEAREAVYQESLRERQ